MSDMKESRLEDTIQELEEIYSLLLDKSSDPIFAFSPEGRYLYVNRAFAEGVEKSVDQITGKTIYDVFDREEADKRFTALNHVFQSGKEKVIEVLVPRANGDKYFVTTITPILDSQARVTKVICSSKDITGRKQMEMTLRENEEKYRAFFSTSRDSVFITSAEGYFLDLNDAMVELLGYNSREELQGVRIDKLYAGLEDRARHLRVINELGSTKDHPVNLCKKDGTIINTIISTVIRKDSTGSIMGYQGTIRDITAQKLAEEALAQERQRLASIIEGTDAGTWEWNIQTGATVFNQRWAKIVGYTLEELAPISINTWMELGHPEDLKRSGELLEAHFRGELNLYDCEVRMRHKNGTWVWVQERGRVITRSCDGKPLMMFGTHTDITERKQAEEFREETQRQLEQIIELLPDATFVINNQGQVVFWNKAIEEMTGIPKEQMIGKGNYEYAIPFYSERRPILIDYALMSSNDYDELKNKYDFILKQGDTLFGEIYLSKINSGKGAHLSVSTCKLCDLHGNTVGAIESMRDITNRNKAELALALEKQNLHITLESIGDGVISTDSQGKIKLLNRVAERLTGWTQNEAYSKPFAEVFNIINEFTKRRCKNPVHKVLNTGNISELANHTILISKEGMERFCEGSVSPINDKDGNVNGVVLVFRDITEKKERLEKINYLSYHDPLTGLFNRRFYEEELKRLDVERNLPLTLVMADVNGLKLINDAFGHLQGDKLLKRAAEVMKKECRADDIIARIGGDEFVLLLPKTDSEQAANIVKRINKTIANEKLNSSILSISFGWKTKKEAAEEMARVFKEAEDEMYRRKLSESASLRNKTVQAMIKTLYEKNEREQKHSVRTSQLCQAIGAALDSNVEDISELRTVGLLHDIGKITLDSRILDKSGALSDSEWHKIKQHSETGYRILSSINEFSQLAEYVLAHHERWDGLGYPKGLKGEEIPLKARIIAVADTYDAMISNRPYRKALSKDAAIKEIERNAGTQLDPDIARIFVEKVLGKNRVSLIS